MNKTVKIALFGLLALAQLAVPVHMVIQQEKIFASGFSYKFETEPVDPMNPFRGRYMNLALKAATVKNRDGNTFSPGERVYARVKTNDQGFAEITELSRNPPESGDYFAAKVRWSGQKDIRLETPFERYYLEEGKAPKAESAYWKANRERHQKPCWLIVKIRNGQTTIVDLYIDNLPVKEYLRKNTPVK